MFQCDHIISALVPEAMREYSNMYNEDPVMEGDDEQDLIISEGEEGNMQEDMPPTQSQFHRGSQQKSKVSSHPRPSSTTTSESSVSAHTTERTQHRQCRGGQRGDGETVRNVSVSASSTLSKRKWVEESDIEEVDEDELESIRAKADKVQVRK
jgi:hypothetical protein